MLNVKQQKVIDIVNASMKDSKSSTILNVVGEGGTGKSYLIKCIVDKYPEVVVTATTGIAAKNIDGITIHSLLGLVGEFNDDTESLHDMLSMKIGGKGVEDAKDMTVIIDESSMMGKELFDKVIDAGFKRVLLFGDKQQLPPVRDVEVDYTQYETIELTEQMRTKSNAYKLISAYREAKESGEDIDIFSFVDGKSVEHITSKEMVEHFSNNPSEDKRVISYTNEMADKVVSVIKPSSNIYQLHSPVIVYDGKKNHTLAVNGEVVEIKASFETHWESQQAFKKEYGAPSNHRTTWHDNYPFHTHKVSLKGIKTHFIRLLVDGKEIYEKYLDKQYLEITALRTQLKKKFGDRWSENKPKKYNDLVKDVMQLSKNIVRARHVCSTTAHKAQGQSIDCVYIMVKNIGDRPELMYVALSRAVNKIVLVYNGTT